MMAAMGVTPVNMVLDECLQNELILIMVERYLLRMTNYAS